MFVPKRFRNRLDESFPKSTNLPYVSPMVDATFPPKMARLTPHSYKIFATLFDDLRTTKKSF
jgi:hypothetical protein